MKWSVAITVKAPPVVLKAFIAHHLRLGASEIHMFFDDPQDPSFEVVANIPGIRATRCTGAHWDESVGSRPDSVPRRQGANARLALKNTDCAWMAHLDADEFLHPRTSVEAALEAVPPVADAVRLPACENVSRSVPRTYADMYRGPFKKPLPTGPDGDVAAARMYGRLGASLTRGLQGHQGKLFLRTSSGAIFRTKSAEYRTRSELPEPLGDEELESKVARRVLPYQQHDLQLLHFFTMGEGNWRAKNARRFDRSFGRSQDLSGRELWLAFREVAQQQPEALGGMFRTLNVLTDEQSRVLETLGALVEAPLDLQDGVEGLFGPGDHGFGDALPGMSIEEVLEILSDGFPAGGVERGSRRSRAGQRASHRRP